MKRRTWLLASLSFTVLAAALFAVAPTPSPEPAGISSSAAQSQPLTRGESALRAFYNPETGQVEVTSVPSTLELDAATREALRQDDTGLKQTVLPDGTVLIDMQGRFQSVATVRIDENGKRVICTDTADKINAMAQDTPDAQPRQTPEVK